MGGGTQRFGGQVIPVLRGISTIFNLNVGDRIMPVPQRCPHPSPWNLYEYVTSHGKRESQV